MPVKILAFDLDDTTIIRHKDLPTENLNALKAAHKNKVIIVPATGRIKTFLPKELAEMEEIQFAISCNGASVDNIRTGENIYRALIPNEAALKIQSILDEYDIYTEYYCDGQAYTLVGNLERARTDFQFPEPKFHFLSKGYKFINNFNEFIINENISPDKINLPYLLPHVKAQLIERINALGGLKLTSSIPDNLEINANEANKGAGLKALCEYLKINPSEAMAIGDNGNDVDMLLYAGVSVAMENASKEAKEAAKFTTDSCENLGFKKAVERFILN